ALARERPRASVENGLSSKLPAALAAALVRENGALGDVTLGHLSRDARRRLAHTLTGFRLPIADTRGYGYAEATAGGVTLTEIDPATMESRVCPGLFLV